MAQQNPVVIDMGTPAPALGAAPTPAAPEKKGNDTLFGPNIGVLGGGPAWTESSEKSSDVLTPDIVKNWIAKSKEVSPSSDVFARRPWPANSCGCAREALATVVRATSSGRLDSCETWACPPECAALMVARRIAFPPRYPT